MQVWRKSGQHCIGSVDAKRVLLYSCQLYIKCICCQSLPSSTSIRRSDASGSRRKGCFCYSTYRFRQMVIYILAATTMCKPFCLKRYLWQSSPEAPWVLAVRLVISIMREQAKTLFRIADVVPLILLKEDAEDNGSWTRYCSILRCHR